jgi:hypothetical protein
MGCNDYLKFKGVDNIGDTLLMSELEGNLKTFFDWSMLCIGNWNNVDIPTSGAYGGDFSTLRTVVDNSYTDGQVWQGARKDWIWETGVDYAVPSETGTISSIDWTAGDNYTITLNGGTSIAKSGDYLRTTSTTGDSAFNTDYLINTVNSTTGYETTSTTAPEGDVSGGNWQVVTNPQHNKTIEVQVDSVVSNTGDYYIDYPLGRIIFNTAISTTATVQAEYSYRGTQVYQADNAQWWHEVQHNSFRPDDEQFTQSVNNGEWSIGANHRVQLPAIVVEAVPRASSRGYQLGDGSLLIKQDVIFHVIAEDRHSRNQLLDICRMQQDKTIWLYDTNKISTADAFPLDYRGMKVGDNMYPDLVSENGGFRWKKCYFSNTIVSAMETPNPYLYAGVVRTTMEIILADIT